MDFKEINCTNSVKEDILLPEDNSKFVEEPTVVSKEIDSTTDTSCKKSLNNLSNSSNSYFIEHCYNKDGEDNAEVADIEVWDNGNSCSDSDVAQNIEDFPKVCRLEESESLDEALTEMNTGLLNSDEVCGNSTEKCAVEVDASGLIFMEENEAVLEVQNRTSAQMEEISVPPNDASEQGHKNDTEQNKIGSHIDNSEELRMNIKLQLSNLRMKKNTNIFQNIKKTAVPQIPEDTLSSLNEKSNDSKCSNPNSYDKSDKSSDSNNKLLSTSTETIRTYQNNDSAKKSTVLNFQGIFPNNSETNKESTSTMMEVDSAIEEDVPNVFNEIRKIIRKPKTLTVASFAHMKEPGIKIASVVSLHDAIKSEAEQFVSIPKKLDMGPNSSNTSSPFISNSLDEFLNDAKLNVSYTIPKSGAEEGLTKDYSAVVIPVVPIGNQIKEESNEARDKSEYKPKTLAEKRRILEMNRKLEERQQKRMKKLQQQQQLQQDIDSTVLKPMPLKTSYVLFKNIQYFVKTQSQRECIASIESKRDENSANDSANTSSIKKPSLLKEMFKKTYNVGYRPGPLSRKKALQIDASKWKTDLKFLPKVELQVIPEFGKPIHPNLVPYLNEENWEISDQRREFALTALAANIDSDTKPCVLNYYPLKYERNQELILVRKKILNSHATNLTEIDVESAEINQEVSKVLNNLLNYVEISEIASSLLKDDVDYDEPYTREVPVQNIQKKRRKRPFKKITKTNKELLRLNCKVLSLDLSETQEEIDCTNAECLLGCICETLECATVIGAHCQKPKCMFKCSCSKRYHLSVDTVSRIEDQAKRNLAKEEKKFTQTVIYSNDRAIFVNTDKPRRAARMPNKYNDFLDDELNDWKLTISQCNKPCSVKLEKFDFSDIIPYCLSHKMYDCYCDGQSISNIVPVKIPEIPLSPPSPPPYKEQSNNQFSTTNNSVVKKGKAYKRKTRFNRAKKKSKNTNNEIVLNQAECLKLELALRSSNSKQQEESETSKNHRRKQRLQVREEVSSAIVSSADSHHSESNNDEADVNSNTVFPGEIVLNDPQWINALCKNDTKKSFKASVRILPWKALYIGFITKVINVFCIIEMPLKLVINVGEKLKNRKVIDIRTHPKYVLNFNLKGNSDWCNGKSETIRDMVKWLTTGKLPSKYNPLTLSFLLVEIATSGYYEVRGVCVQNTKNNSYLDSTIVEQQPNVDGKKSITNESIDEIKHTNMNDEIVSLYIIKRNYRLRELIEDGKEDDLSDNLYMWVGLPEVSRVAKWRVVFLFKDFMYLYFKDIDYSIKHSDLVKLTQISKDSACTLVIRNLQIRKNHAHAAFAIYVSPKYSDRIFIGPYFINYDGEDIDTLKNMSGVLVSSESLNKIKGIEDYRCGHWMHERAYHVPKKSIKNDINELKFSEDEPTVPSAVAEIEATVSVAEIEAPVEGAETEAAASATITSKLGTEIQSVSSNSLLINKVKVARSAPPPLRRFDRILKHNGFSLRVQYCKPRAPADYNRFIITNIPHFGYLGAYQSANSHAIEVSWPFEEQVLVFENADNARDFLQDKFNQVLQPIPESFKIQVIVLVQLDLNDHKPINPAHLNMQCICGYFGTYNLRELSDEDCVAKIDMTKKEITLLIAKRDRALLSRKLVDLAIVAGINKGTDSLNFMSVIEQSEKIIEEQKQLLMKNRRKIELLEYKADKSSRKLFAMIKALPINLRSLESRILCDTVAIRPKKFRSNEIIEIPDDDDDDNSTTTTSTTTEDAATTSSTIINQHAEIRKRKSSLNNIAVSKPKIRKLENSNSETPSVLNITKITGNEELKTLDNSKDIVIAIEDDDED